MFQGMGIVADWQLVSPLAIAQVRRNQVGNARVFDEFELDPRSRREEIPVAACSTGVCNSYKYQELLNFIGNQFPSGCIARLRGAVE